MLLTLAAGLCLALSLPAAAQMNIPFFSHDLPGIGLPGTAVNAAPDEADIFSSDIPMCLSGWQRGNNFLFYDNIVDLGLMPSDNIDAYSLMHGAEVHPMYPFWRFSVDSNTQGLPLTAVNREWQYNAADIFWADGNMGWNFLCLWDWNLGLDCRDDLDALDDREPEPFVEWVYFSLTPGSPTLAVIGATPDDILGVIPRSGMLPVVVVPAWQIGLTGQDNLDALTVVGAPGQITDVYFSVTQGAVGVPGSAVNMKFPLNGADIYWSPLSGTNVMTWPAPQLGLLDHEELDALDPDVPPGGPPIKPATIGASYVCTPGVGTVPFVSNMAVTLTNFYPGQIRRVAGRIDVTLANGAFYPNWRSGFTNIAPGASFNTSWTQNFPAVGSIIGNNAFQLFAEDVTPAPYNQCPYPPSGDTATSTCIIVANTP
jgi:hypothetical protein